MDTNILYFKIYEHKVTSSDYVNWAIEMLLNDYSTDSLIILASFIEPLNIFEVEEYFKRSLKELNITKPTQQECAEYYINHLISEIIKNEKAAIDIAYEVYKIIREHIIEEELSVWYELSDLIDDYRYGDNIENITKEDLIRKIVEEAKKQINK